MTREERSRDGRLGYYLVAFLIWIGERTGPNPKHPERMGLRVVKNEMKREKDKP